MVSLTHVPKLAIVLTLTLAFLSGCVVDPGVEKVASEDAAPAQPTTTSVSDVPNQAPTALITATIAGAAATIASNQLTIDEGTAVDFSAASSTDPDGDALTFAWTLDDADLGAGQTLSHAFDEAGTYTLGLTASDGDLDAQAALTVLVEAVETTAPPAAGGAVTYVIEGAFPDPVFHEPLLFGEPIVEGTPVDHPFEVPAGATGLTAYLSWSDAVSHPTITDLDLYLLDGTGTEQGRAATVSTFELAQITDAAKLPPGLWTAHVNPFQVPPEVVEYTVEIVIWTGTPTETVFTGSNEAAVNVGAGTPAETASTIHTFTVPAGAKAITARLVWEIPGVVSCVDEDPVFGLPASVVPTAPNDFDFYVYGPTGSEVFHSGDAISCEFGLTGGDLAPGDYTVEVVPFLITAAEYTLTVQVG